MVPEKEPSQEPPISVPDRGHDRPTWVNSLHFFLLLSSRPSWGKWKASFLLFVGAGR